MVNEEGGMTLKPLGPDGVKARMDAIDSKMRTVFGEGFSQKLEETKLSSERAWQPPSGSLSLRPLDAFSDGAKDLVPVADQIAEENGLDVELFRNLVQAESGWNPKSVSPKGAAGLTQLMPATARSLGVTDPFDPVQNLRGGARYLKGLLQEFGSPELALAAYNAGPGAVRRYGGVPPFSETQNYVKKILGKNR